MRFVEDDVLARNSMEQKRKKYEQEYHEHSHKNLIENEDYYRARAEISKLLYFDDIKEEDIVLDYGCFTAESKVTLNDFTQIPISQLQKGDKLLNHNGRLSTVIKKLKRKINKTIAISVRGEESINTTPEHPFLAIKREHFTCCNNVLIRFGQRCCFCNKSLKPKPQFIQAKDLKIGDYLINPIPKERRLKQIYVSKYLKNHQIRKCKSKKILKLKITKNLMKVFGLWLAEGSFMKAHNKINGIKFSFNLNRNDLIQFTYNFIKKWGNAQIRKRPHKNITEVYLCNKYIGLLFFELFNEKSKTKRIHKDLFYTNASNLLELFKGFYEGDGNSRKDSKQCYVRLTTLSPKLLNQLYWIALINHLPINKYKIRLVLNGDCRIIVPSLKPNHKYKSLNRHTQSFCYNNKYILRPIYKKTISTKKQEVYNLRVSPPHTYLINNLAVHNCGVGQNIFFIPNAFGYDISKFALLEATKRGIKTIMDPVFTKEKFDVIFSRHVLEHLENPIAALNIMKYALKPGGKLILVLPIERQRFVKIEETQNQHLYGWNFQTINNLLFKAGFQPIDNEYLRGAGYHKLLFIYKKNFKLYRFFTKLASYWSGSKEMKITAIKK